ncbi:MAG: VTT domain-containing protein [Opitutales bacterium]
MSEHADSAVSGILRPGGNCWCVSRVERGAFAIDGANYYRAFREAVLQARRSVVILAWDISEGIELLREEDPRDGFPTELVDFLYAVLDAKPELEIYILLWDYSMVYLHEREWLPLTRWRREPHPRLIMEKDDAICMGASQHQKVVVVDGGFAFTGGLDLSVWRWDTTEHRAVDPRRQDPRGKPYRPYHDIQMALTGEVVRYLDQLCFWRWKRATGYVPPTVPKEIAAQPVWPKSLEVDFEEATAGIALTFSEYKNYPPVRQVEQFHLDVIQQARNYLYIENQYLSSHTLTRALVEKLHEPDGPEVIIVLTQDTGGLLEEGTLGVLRTRLLEELREEDGYGRLRVYYPHVQDPDGRESQVYVHAKVILCDDRIIKVGSSNLTNRSMKVDSEVDIVLAEESDFPPVRELLCRLLGIHFGCSAATAHDALERGGSIRAAIDLLRPNSSHYLRDMPLPALGPIQRKLADTQILDPDEPIDPGHRLRKTFFKNGTNESKRPGKRNLWVKASLWLLVGLALVFGAGAGWNNVLDRETVVGVLEAYQNNEFMVPMLFLAFVVAGLVALPINLLLVAATFVLGPWAALGCGFAGSLVSAVFAFWVGHFCGKPLVKRFARETASELINKISERGAWSIALVRLVPIAPFVVINLVAGSSHLKFSTFLSGSILGMLPGMLTVVWLARQVRALLLNPGWKTGIGLVLALGLVVIIATLLKKTYKS